MTKHDRLSIVPSIALIVPLALFGSGCDDMTAPDAEAARAVQSVPALAEAAAHTQASGTFNQTSINDLQVRAAGPNTILEQRSSGSITGTLQGEYEDDLRLVIHPNGNFTAQFTITCQCTVDGREGTLELVAGDRGQLVSPDLAVFEGRAVITGGTGDLSGLRGVLDIEGTVDVQSGLSTYDYTGTLRLHP